MNQPPPAGESAPVDHDFPVTAEKVDSKTLVLSNQRNTVGIYQGGLSVVKKCLHGAIVLMKSRRVVAIFGIGFSV